MTAVSVSSSRHTPRMRGIQYATASRFHHWRLWNTGSPAFAGDDSPGRDSAISRTDAPEFCLETPALSNQRAQGMPGARCARSRVCSVESTRVSHHGHTGITRHSPRNGFNGFLRALPSDRACLPLSLAKVVFRQLDASVGASGPHDRPPHAPLVCSASASTASRPAAVTIACRPSVGRDGGGYRFDLG
jgi:hypothetical protein